MENNVCTQIQNIDNPQYEGFLSNVFNRAVNSLKNYGFKIKYIEDDAGKQVYGMINGKTIMLCDKYDVETQLETLYTIVSNYYCHECDPRKSGELRARLSENPGQLYKNSTYNNNWLMRKGEKIYNVMAFSSMCAFEKQSTAVRGRKPKVKDTSFNGIDSRDVAEMIDKSHAHLMRDINKYVEILENSNETKNGLVEFFIKNSYKDNKGETRSCYTLTRKGCEFVANKMTGEKGILFTAAYINKFHEMEQGINTKTKLKIVKDDNTKEIDAKIKLSNQLLKLSKNNALSLELKNSLTLKASEVIKDIVEATTNE